MHLLVAGEFEAAEQQKLLYPTAPNSRRVPEADVRHTLRCCLSEWGTLPDEIQTDGEPVLVGKAGDDFPSCFTLWLVGFVGIHHLVIAPGKPTQNGGGERDHRTTCDYAVVGQTHLGPQQLQAQVDLSRAI